MTTTLTFSGTLLPPESNVDTTMCELCALAARPERIGRCRAVIGATFTGFATAMQRAGIDLCQDTCRALASDPTT